MKLIKFIQESKTFFHIRKIQVNYANLRIKHVYFSAAR